MSNSRIFLGTIVIGLFVLLFLYVCVPHAFG